MRFTCRAVAGAGALAAMAGSAAPALAVPCGQPPAGGGDPTQATLVLNPDRTQNNPLQFGGSTHDKAFRLFYDVTGCTLTDSAGLRIRVHADRDVASAFAPPDVSAEGSFLLIEQNVRADFPTGSASALLTIGGSRVVPIAQPLSLQRKEPATWPFILTVVAALLGGLTAIFTTYLGLTDRIKRGEHIKLSPLHGIVALGAGALATVAVYETSYVKPETFTLDLSTGLALFVAAAAAAAGGAKAGAGSTVAIARRKGGDTATDTAVEPPAKTEVQEAAVADA